MRHNDPPALCRPLKTHETSWTPQQQDFKVTLNLALDGCIVPTQSGSARVDYAHLVVLDNFIDEATRQQLLDFLTEPGWSRELHSRPPSSKWERATCDAAGKARTWGLSSSVLQRFAAEDVPAKLEVQSRLCKLYPDCIIAHMPSDSIQLGLGAAATAAATAATETAAAAAAAAEGGPAAKGASAGGRGSQGGAAGCVATGPTAATGDGQQQLQQQQLQQQQQEEEDEEDEPEPSSAAAPALATTPEAASTVDCSCFLANAAVHGDCFSWHVDADPTTFPSPSPWSQQYGTYCNREPGKPLFVSLLLYLDDSWPLECDAETLFLDSMTDTGVFVRPKRCRAVLLDQDVAHRLSMPSAAAGRPRYSLVWKLVMVPNNTSSGNSSCSIARPEWGRPTYFGSAAQVEKAARQAAAAAAVAQEGSLVGQKRPAIVLQ